MSSWRNRLRKNEPNSQAGSVAAARASAEISSASTRGTGRPVAVVSEVVLVVVMSGPGEARRALGHEGADALGEVLGVEGRVAQLRGGVVVAHLAAHDLVDHDLAGAHAELRAAAHGLGEAVRQLLELVGRDDLVEEAELVGPRGRDLEAAVEDPLGPGRTDQVDHPLGGLEAVDEAELAGRDGELRLVVGEPDVAGEGKAR